MQWKAVRALLLFTFGCMVITAEQYAEPKPQFSLMDIISSDERIQAHGYPAESHTVTTEDGYVLQLFRIPNSPRSHNRYENRPAVLLQHGLFSNSDCWLSSGPDNSLAYLLADAGYDVWLGNARGNIYSRHNELVSINSHKFWHFSWHEIGTIDVAAMIDYIIAETDQPAIHYGGHSQGTTVYMVLLSERPEYNAKIKTGHLLAPCAFLEHGRSPVFNFLGPLVGTPGGVWNSIFTDTELLPRNDLINRMVDNTCGGRGAYTPLCRNFYLWFTADGYQNTNMTSMQILVETHPGGSSSNQGIHYLQLWASHKFRQYDWGAKKNRELYGQDTPPDYDLSRISAQTHSYSSQNDVLCSPDDVDTLVANFPQLAEDYRIPEPSFNHLDFIVAVQMKEELNDRIIDTINKYEGRL